jgi:threonine/homoserine/homoserine lactone efflux protein
MIVGFSIAAPVGPIGVLCIHRTLTDGRHAGLASEIGAARLWCLESGGGLGMFRENLDTRGPGRVDRLSGAVITGFGLITLFNLKH